MDIQELGQFESAYKPSKEVAFCWLRKQYVQLSTEEDHTEIANHANDSLRIWQAAKVESHKQAALYQFEINHLAQANQQWREKAAKAQAVPDVQQALNDRLLVRSIRERVESHIAEIRVNDLFDKGWLAAMKCIQNNIDMLEAQDPTND